MRCHCKPMIIAKIKDTDLVRVQNNGNSHLFLVGMPNGLATLKQFDSFFIKLNIHL